MCNPWTRRDVVKAAAIAGLGTCFSASARTQTVQKGNGLLLDGKLSPFPMHSVRLLEGDFRRGEEVNAQYLDSLSVDRLLHTFRLTAGLPSTAIPYGGWEKPTSELRGHFAGGHYLSAVAFAYAGSGNTTLRDKGNALVSGLAACQKANGNGYLSAYPQAFFERLARAQNVWAPFYTYHKIMAGLVDMHLQTGNSEALQVAEGMAGWVSAYFADIGEDQRQRMLRVEFGGMNEVLVNLYSITGKERYLKTAMRFEQASFLDPLAARRDELQGLHANTNVPKVIGAARMYEVTGETRYREIAEFFLGDVLAGRTYSIGNTSDDEHWRTPSGTLSGTLSLKNAECCVAYNLMKLERHAFAWTGDSRWMDEYERSLFNARLGTQNQQGLKQYFFPLAAGYWRSYGAAEDAFWCCTGTGAEDFAKFGDSIYFRKGNDVYVNLFLPSVLTWKEQDFTLRQETSFPIEPITQLTVGTSKPQRRAIAIRIPGWVADGGQMSINGKPLEIFAEPGSYLSVTRIWQDGDKIRLTLPMALREEILAGDKQTVAALYGPLVLAADLGAGPTDGPLRILSTTAPVGAGAPLPTPVVNSDGWLEHASGAGLNFRARQTNGSALDVMPLYQVRDQRYAVYWQKNNNKA